MTRQPVRAGRAQPDGKARSAPYGEFIAIFEEVNTRMQHYQAFINGSFCNAADGRTMETINPYTAKPWATVARCGKEDVNRAVAAARAAFDHGPWRTMTATQRGAIMRKFGDLIAENADHLAAIETRDNGKLFAEMRTQLRYIPQWFYYFGGLADKIEGAVLPIDKPDMFVFTRREAVGVVAAITPWNSPLLLTTWKLAPALAAGCTMVLKPSEHTSASTIELMKLAKEAGFPDGVLNVVPGLGADVGAPLVEHPGVDKVAFTGGDIGGRHVAEAAARGFKHVTLELGGKSPQLIFGDADLESAIYGVVSGIFAASGQTCIAGSRVLVHKSLHDAFVEGFVNLAASARLGDPMNLETQVGPVTTEAQFQRVLSYMDIAREGGAECVMGGGKATVEGAEDGWFVQPTAFTKVSNDMRIAQEEVFGPLLSIIPFESDEEAFTAANDSIYGLAAGVWTKDMARAFKASERLRAGTIWTNTYRAVSYMAPFGGFKHSGLGRESGQHAIDDYLETKTTWMSFGAKTGNPFVIS